MTAPMWYQTGNRKWHQSVDGKRARCGCDVTKPKDIVPINCEGMDLCKRCVDITMAAIFGPKHKPDADEVEWNRRFAEIMREDQ